MNILINNKLFNINDVFFQESVKNTIMNESSFTRILYSNNIFILNGIHLLINLKIDKIEKYYHKYICHFNINSNNEIIDTIINIERKILNKYNTKKVYNLNIGQQLMSSNIKILDDDISIGDIRDEFILKLSGIWENEKEYGITYKIIPI
jgi:hypothetical protein